MEKIKAHGRFIVSAVALTIAFVLSVQFSDRGVQFDLRNATVSASETNEDGAYDLAALKILNRVLLQIKDNYVEPERIRPNKMLVYALDEIQNSIAEVVVDFDRGKDDHPQRVTVAVNEKSKSFEIGKIESLWEMSFRLKEIFHFVQEHLEPSAEVKYRDVEYAAINGMLTTLDPHSTLLPPEYYEEMQTQTGGKFGGLGIVISVRDGALTVISPIDGTPAANKGIKARDQIVRIGEASTVNMNLTEAVDMLRGEPGTDIDLWILRKGWSEARQYTVTRDIIKIDSVDSQALGDKVGYIRIKNFQANTYPDLKKHLGKLKEKMGGMQGLVLDMRDNPGGLLDQAIKVSDLFIEEGAIVSTVGVGNRLREKREARRAGSEPSYPILVLVNAGSASASEIVAGALQNHDRAVVLGDTTFGKGSVQVLYEFPDNSALKLTVAQYLTPGGISIQSSGIVPDLRIIPVAVTDDEIDMFLSHNVMREQDLSSHLTNQNVRQQVKDGKLFVRYLNEKSGDEEDEFRDPDAFEEDFEIRMAQQLLAQAGTEWNRAKLIEKLQPELQKVSDAELTRITAELSKQGIDWTRGPSATKPELDVKVTTSAAKGLVKAGEELIMTVSATNKGNETFHQLKAISKSDSATLDDREFLFGKLTPGQTKLWKVKMTVPKDSPSRHDIVGLEFSDAQNIYADIKSDAQVRVVGADRPQFAFSYDIIDASGDGVLTTGETATLRVFVRNAGKADSGETLVYLKNLAGETVYLKTGRTTLDKVGAGATVPVEFTFTVKSAPAGEAVELEIDIYDSTFREFTQKKFSLPFANADKKAASASGNAVVKTGPAKLFAASSTKSDIAAIARAGATLPVTGKLDNWYRVELDGRTAWIQGDLVTAKPETAKLAGLKTDIMFQPPSIQLTTASMVTSDGNVSLEGLATDDSGVKDYYIFVYNRDASKVNTKKLQYVRASGEQVKIDTKVPLFKGMNRIAVVARDDDGMSTTQSAYVFRK